MTDGEQYAIAWAAPARRALARIREKSATAAIDFAYGAMAENPHRVGRRLRWELEGMWSARRGDYRLVHRIDDDARRVDVLAIEHRADVYRRRS